VAYRSRVNRFDVRLNLCSEGERDSNLVSGRRESSLSLLLVRSSSWRD
jgi:hypothetical protein